MKPFIAATILSLTITCSSWAQQVIIIERENNQMPPPIQQDYQPRTTWGKNKARADHAQDYTSGLAEGRNDACRLLSARSSKERKDAQQRSFDGDKGYKEGSPSFKQGYEDGFNKTLSRY